MKTYEQVVQELDAKIPQDAVSLREGGGGKKLSYLAGHYVIDRMNKVFGHGNWSYDSNVTLLHSGTVKGNYGETHTVHYSARILLVVKYPNGEQASYVDYGYGDGSDKNNVGKAHELAIKESITDGLKRCAKNLGMSMGLALYSKEQENVESEAPVARSPKVEAEAKQAAANTMAKLGSTFKKMAQNDVSRDTVNKQIAANSSVVIAKKLKSKDDLLAAMKEKYQVTSKEQLTDDQAQEFLSTLKGMIA